MAQKTKNKPSDVEKEVVSNFYLAKYASVCESILDLELELEYLVSAAGKARLTEELGSQEFTKIFEKEKRTLESKKSFKNFLQKKLS